MATRIFINYRRDDTTSTAGRLHDRLAESFGRENLFMDVDHIPAGVDFIDHLHTQVAACNDFLAIIGPTGWMPEMRTASAGLMLQTILFPSK
jgi:TIR domain